MQSRTAHTIETVVRPRGPGTAYAVLSLVLLIAIATVALASRQTAPPTIAEFAPQAVERITDASSDAAGTGAGTRNERDGLDGASAGDPVRPTTSDVARVRQCVGDPPRQIEDPQSPPCVPYWSGDNGGATSHGVTRDEIRVADPFHQPRFSPALEAFFNRRFEFYGRQLRLIPRSPGSGEEGERATAHAVRVEDRAFASLLPQGEEPDAYFSALAREGVIGVSWLTNFPEADLAAGRPYLWSYPMANDRLFAATGGMYCARLAGRNATHAGEPVLQTTRRKSGVILVKPYAWGGTSVEPVTSALASCGERTDAVIQDTFNPFDGGAAAYMENAMLQMRSSGVTTVVFLGHWLKLQFGMRAATNQGYYPEWIVNAYLFNDSRDTMYVWEPAEQRRSVMALKPRPMDRPFDQHASLWAIERFPERDEGMDYIDAIYSELLLLASGFQMAGPHLTPETFERGLHQTRFPNPPHPIMAGSVGFDDGDHSMTDDVAEMWWSNTDLPPYTDFWAGTGTYCYLDGGARRRLGTFPADDAFFRGPCDNGAS